MLEVAALVALTFAQPAAGAPPAASPAMRTQTPPAADPVAPTPPTAELLTLDGALAEAASKNLDLAQARARLEQARAGVNRAWSAQLPQVAATGAYTRYDKESVIPAGVIGPDPITLQPRNQLAGQLEVTQALIAPQAWFGIRSSRLGARVADDTVENARRELLFAVAQAYYGAVSVKKAIGVQERQLAITLAHEKDARVRFEAGTVPKVTLLRAEIDRARAEQDLKRTQNGYESAKVILATLLDREQPSFDVDVPPAPRLPENLDALEQVALRERPDVRAADTSLRLAESNRQAVRARYFPVIGAFGRYQITNTAGFTGDEDVITYGLQARWDIFDGGLREADLRDTDARISEAQSAKRATENRAVEEVRRARLDRDSAVSNRVIAEEQLSLARENQRLVEVNFRAGAATYLEVSDANTALAAAELAVITETLNADLASVRLLQTSGGFPAR
ncbi:MAG TPA: TolC family protein [Anaeromyxobacteraceae bacterium]|nr:TolC family protein [Anaeromyxobacteraceae bacterium]